MPSKTSSRLPTPAALWKAARDCSERELIASADLLAKLLRVGDRVLLEGEMGAGKSTFARALIKGLGVNKPPEGSPSFALAHEYRSVKGEIVHLDFYRLKSELEIEEAGIHDYFWERDAIVLSEWISNFPSFEASVMNDRLKSRAVWTVRIKFGSSPDTRELEIRRQET